MKIISIEIFRRQRKIKINLENNQYICYQRFGKDLIALQEYGNLVKKSSPTLIDIKRQLINTPYFQSKGEISPEEIKQIEKICKNFVNLEVETVI